MDLGTMATRVSPASVSLSTESFNFSSTFKLAVKLEDF